MATKKTAKTTDKKAPSTDVDGDTDSLTIDYETALKELEQIVERMEDGDQTLEATVKDFERGVTLSRRCHASLKQAEQRIDKLVSVDAASETEDVDLT